MSIALVLSLAALAADPPEVTSYTSMSVPVEVRVPDVEPHEWEVTVGDGVRLTRPRGRLPHVVVGGITGAYQPDMARMDDAAISTMFRMPSSTAGLTFGELDISRAEHDTLGPLAVGVGTATLTGAEAPFAVQVALFEMEGGVGAAIGVHDGEPEVLEADLTAVLDMILPKKPRVPADQLAFGQFASDGYELALPDGWRAATRYEQSGMDLGRLQPFFDPAAVPDDHVPVFGCVTSKVPVPMVVLHPSKSSTLAHNYRVRARSSLSGKGFRRPGPDGDVVVRVEVKGDPVKPSDGDGDLQAIPIGERDAFLWWTEGTVDEQPVRIGTFFTSWDNIELDCAVVAPEGSPALDAFDSAMRSLRVTDGDEHPMAYDMVSLYRRWWPFAHPALQLHWWILALSLLSVAGFIFSFRGPRGPRAKSAKLDLHSRPPEE